MNIEKINTWLTLIANVGVLAGIVFLALEIQQSNRIAIATTDLGIGEGFNSFNESVYEDKDMSVLLARAMSAEAEFSPDEEVALRLWLYVFLNTHVSAEIAYINGLATEETYEGNFRDARSVYQRYPGLHTILRGVVDNFLENAEDIEFVTYLDQLLTDPANS